MKDDIEKLLLEFFKKPFCDYCKNNDGGMDHNKRWIPLSAVCTSCKIESTTWCLSQEKAKVLAEEIINLTNKEVL